MIESVFKCCIKSDTQTHYLVSIIIRVYQKCYNAIDFFVLVRKKNDNTTTGNSTIFAYNPFGAAMYGGAVAGIGNMLPANTQPQGMSAVEVQKMITHFL